MTPPPKFIDPKLSRLSGWGGWKLLFCWRFWLLWGLIGLLYSYLGCCWWFCCWFCCWFCWGGSWLRWPLSSPPLIPSCPLSKLSEYLLELLLFIMEPKDGIFPIFPSPPNPLRLPRPIELRTLLGSMLFMPCIPMKLFRFIPPPPNWWGICGCCLMLISLESSWFW